MPLKIFTSCMYWNRDDIRFFGVVRNIYDSLG